VQADEPSFVRVTVCVGWLVPEEAPSATRKSAVWHLAGAAAADDAVLAAAALLAAVLAAAVALAAAVVVSALAWADVLELELAELQAASPMPTASDTAAPAALVIGCTNIPFPRMR
jgi:hypothetical protein